MRYIRKEKSSGDRGHSGNNLAQSCFRMLESIMVDYTEVRKKALTEDEVSLVLSCSITFFP